MFLVGCCRIAPDRRWFGNTRVISQNELDQFREKVTAAKSDPYSVLLRRKKIPMALLKDAADAEKTKDGNLNVAATKEGYQGAFGKNATRKRPKMAATSYEALMDHVQANQSKAMDTVSAGEDGQEDKSKLIKDDMFAKGQSKRIWGELYKVLDCSDVVLQVSTYCFRVNIYLIIISVDR